jgi:hypothetical protein
MRKLIILAVLMFTPFAFGQTTPQLGLNIPASNTPNWGNLLNNNFSLLDSLLSGISPLPALNVTGPAILPELQTWQSGTTYSTGEVVAYLGIFYSSISSGNMGNLPTNATFWTTSIGGGLPSIPTGTVLGNNSGSTAAPTALTVSQVATLLGLGTASTQPSSAFDAAGSAATAQANAEGFTSASFAPKASPAFTGTPTVPTAAVGTNTTQAASTAFAAAAATAAQSSSLQKANNLSDLASAPAARTSLGLGTASTQATSSFDAAGAATSAIAGPINPTSIGATTPAPIAATTLTTTGNAGLKVVNGTSHSEMYSGATLDVRVNACLEDALDMTNGNTTGLCDASGEGGGGLGAHAVAAQITVGDINNDPVGLILPCVGFWTGTMTDGVSSIIKQFGGTTIRSQCPAGALGGTMVINNTSTSLPGQMMEIVGSGSRPYVFDSGFNITNISGGHATATGIGLLIEGGFADATTLDLVNVDDSLDAIKVEIHGVCCEFNWIHGSINGEFAGTPLLILTDRSDFTRDFNFSFGTIVHPGTGNFAVDCEDTRQSTVSSFSLDHVYTETGDTGNPSSVYLINGCSRASISHMTIANNGTTDFPAVFVTNAYPTDLALDDMWLVFGNDPWTYPAPAVINNFTGQVLSTDNNGYFSHYSTPTATTTLGPLTTIGQIAYAGPSGAIAALSGNPEATDAVLVSHGAGLTATPTTKTAYVSSTGTITSATATWSANPVAGESVFLGVQDFSGTIASVVDSAGNTYAAVAAAHTPTNIPGIFQLFSFGPLTSTITSVTVNSTSTTGLVIMGDTATNIAATSPVDGAPCYADTFSSISSSCATALTTTAANEYIFCAAQNETGSDAFTPGSGFTAGANAGSVNSLAQYKIQSSIGALTPSITSSSASPMVMGCAAFKTAPSTSAPTLANAPALSTANMTGPIGATTPGTGAFTSLSANSINVLSARKGTFVCTAAGTITIANTHELATSDVVISLNTAGGTISTAPAMKTVTPGTGFTVLCGTDTSTYNYDILN